MFIQQPAPITVPSEGPKNARIALVGEAPGEDEVKAGRPFVGSAGNLLDTCLRAAGLVRNSCYITNLVKVRPGPPDAPNDISKYYNAKRLSLTPAGEIARDSLVRELNEVGANVIVTLGAPATIALTGSRPITKWRGSFLPTLPGLFPTQRKVLATLHPSFSIRGQYLVRFDIVSDLKKALEDSGFPELQLPDRKLVVDMSFQEAIGWIHYFIDEGRKGKPISYDIECINHEVSCISFSSDPLLAVSIPFYNYWDEREEAELWSRIGVLLGDPSIIKVGHNIAAFDNVFMALRNGIVVRGPIRDTMIAHHILYPDFRKGLDYVVSIRTKEPYYKDEGKNWNNPKNWIQFRQYNAKDSACTLEVYHDVWKEMEEDGYQRTWELAERIFPICAYMSCRGIKANRERLAEAKKKVQEQIEDAQKRLDKVVGHPLNVQSPKQCMSYFYGELGIPPYTKVEYKNGEYKSKVTCDDKALQRLSKPIGSRPAVPAAKVAQELRGLLKLKGTYLEIDFDKDDRLRCAVNPRGTVTGRLSTEETVFGTGANIQNIPPAMKIFLEADPGYLLLELDKRQAEWVVVAYLAQDANMLKVVEEGLDPHAYTGMMMTGLPESLIMDEARIIGHSTDPIEIADLREKKFPMGAFKGAKWLPRNMTIRQAGKKSNHGLNYDEQAERFALENEIEVKEAQMMINLYHLEAYPGIRNVYYPSVRRQLQKNRILVNPFGRKRRFLKPWDNKLFKEAYAHYPQSTVVDMVNEGMAQIYDDQDSCRDVDPLAQGHDSFLSQYPCTPTDSPHDMAEAIHAMRHYLTPTISINGRDFQIETDLKIGWNWGEMVEVALGDTERETAWNLKRAYDGLTK